MRLKPNDFKPCIQKIADRAKVNAKKAEEMLQETAARAETFRRRGEADPFGMAARELGEKMKSDAIKDRSDSLRNAMIRRGIFEDVKAAGLSNAALALESAMVHVNTRLPNMRAPLEEVATGLAHRWMTALEVQLHKIGADKEFASGRIDDQVSRELWKMSQVGPMKPKAGKIELAAQAINAPLYAAAERLRGAGARFSHAIDYITTTHHDARAMVDATFEGWWSKTEPRLSEKTFEDLEYSAKGSANMMSPAEARRAFGQRVYNALITGVHNISGGVLHADADGYVPPAFEGTKNLAKKLSQERVLHWKDADSWMAHMREFGGMTTLYRTVHETLQAAANHTALMERFGTNPMASLNMLTRAVQEHYRDTDPLGVIKFNKKISHLQRVMGNLDGSANRPNSVLARQITNTAKDLENASMLGVVGLTHFSSLSATIGAIAPHYNISRFELGANTLKSILQGAAPGEGQNILSELGAFHHGSFSHFAAQIKNAKGAPGVMSATAAITLKASGLNYVLESVQNGTRYFLSHHLGRQMDSDYSALGQQLRDNLSKYGIKEPEWKLLQGVKDQMAVVENRRYATPLDFERQPDHVIDAYNASHIQGFRDTIEAQRQAHMHADAKEEDWVRTRTAKLESNIKSWRKWIDDRSAQRDFKKSEVYLGAESKVEEMREQIKNAKVSQKMAKHVQSLQTSADVHAWTEEVRSAMEGEKQRLMTEGAGDTETEELFRDLAHEEFKGAKEGQTEAVREGATAQESLATKYGRFLARTERKIRQYRTDAASKIKQIEGRDDADTKWFTGKVADVDEDMRQFQGRSDARIWNRAEKLEGLENALPEQIDALRQKTKWQLADGYAAFLAHAGKAATVAAGAREKSWAQSWVGTGELGRLVMQFKTWPLAVVNQIWGRELYSSLTSGQKTVNIFSVLAFSVMGGLFRMMVRDATNGNPIRDPRDPKTLMAALAQGGGVGLLGDFMFGETNRMGGGLMDTLAGPVLGDLGALAKIFYKVRDDTYGIGGDAHHGKGTYSDIWADIAHFTKGHIPFANLIGLKGALDYLLWNHIFEAISPGYWERTNRRQLKEQGRAK